MRQLHLRVWILLGCLVGLLLVAVLTLMQWSATPTVASTTDALSVALNSAQAQGLKTDPTEMYILRGPYSELKPPVYGPSPDDSRTVWVIWLKGTYNLTSPGVRDMPVNHTYIYVDSATGREIQMAAMKEPMKGMGQKSWQKVTKADIGKFPIPRYAVGTGNEPSSPQATDTPIKP